MQTPDEQANEGASVTSEYDFRRVHPNLRFGTASDRYAGWIGQIYPESYRDRISKRSRRLGGRSFQEHTVPIDSVVHYFRHFSILELDFTYYRPLIEESGIASSNLGVLQRYLDNAPETARFLLKVPSMFISRGLIRRENGKSVRIDNPDYLDVAKYLELFHLPAVETVGDRLSGLLFEQEYQRKSDSPPSVQNIEELDSFFGAIPKSVPLHVEMRSPHLLDTQFFDWLETCGLGYVFSHWTWLPPLRKQWAMAGRRFTETRKEAMVRLLTPLRVPYAEAYARTHPFDKVVDEIAGSDEAARMTQDTVALAMEAIKSGGTLNILANNRAWGNAPALAQAIAKQFAEGLDAKRD